MDDIPTAQLISHLDQRYAKLQHENSQLKTRLQLQRKEYEKILVDTKRSYKIQHKRYIEKYELKIKQLTAKLKHAEQSGRDDQRQPLRQKTDNEINSSQSQSQTKPELKFQSPSMPPKEQAPFEADTSDQNGEDFVPTQYSSDTEDSFAGLEKKTPLYQRQWLNDYYTRKFLQDPGFKIDLTNNPITQTKWLVSDFKTVESIDETPPFYYFKDNTSQEERIKQQYYQTNQRTLVDKCFRQVLNRENDFCYDILNAYVASKRYTLSTGT